MRIDGIFVGGRDCLHHWNTEYRSDVKWRNGTFITLRMCISRKGWDIPEIKVAINMYKEDMQTTIIESNITFPELTSKEYKEKLLDIAKKCPVSKIMENSIAIKTTTIE